MVQQSRPESSASLEHEEKQLDKEIEENMEQLDQEIEEQKKEIERKSNI